MTAAAVGDDDDDDDDDGLTHTPTHNQMRSNDHTFICETIIQRCNIHANANVDLYDVTAGEGVGILTDEKRSSKSIVHVIALLRMYMIQHN